MGSIPKSTAISPVSQADVLQAASNIGYTIPDAQLDDYLQLLQKAQDALQAISDEEDYQPTPDLSSTPRKDIHFPDPKDNPLNAWAWRCTATHTSLASTLLQNRTICLKDNIALASVPCLLGTASFEGWIPKTDATVVSRILECSGTILGKAVCENISRGAVSCTAATGPVHNPFAHGYSAGGSSSGTGALVGSGAVDMGLGCDQGGSIRIPAALCGCYGFKATTGLVPYSGIASNDASVDYVGPITRTAMDCAVLLEAIAGVDGLDDRQVAGTPFRDEVPKYSEILETTREQGVKGMRIGVLKEGFGSSFIDREVEAKFREAVKVFEKLGAVVEEVSVPIHAQAGKIYTVLSKMSNHMGMLGKAVGRRQMMLTDLYERKQLPYTQAALGKMNTVSLDGLMFGDYAWSHYPTAYPKSVNFARKLRDAYDAVLTTPYTHRSFPLCIPPSSASGNKAKKFDLLIMPTTPTPSDPLPSANSTPLEYVAATRGKTDNTSAFNASGHPALAMPIGFVKSSFDESVKVPASLQIVGGWWDEVRCLQAAFAWEMEVRDWKKF